MSRMQQRLEGPISNPEEKAKKTAHCLAMNYLYRNAHQALIITILKEISIW